MEKELYINLKAQIEKYLPELKYVALYNNQFDRSNGTGQDGRKEKAFDYPCVFIQFTNSNFRQLSLGVQEYDVEVTVHLGFKSFLNEDLEILDLKERLYWVCQRFQEGSYARFSRVSEEWSWDHDDVSVLKMQFHTYGKDFNRYVFSDGTYTQDTLTGITDTVTAVSGFTGSTDFTDASDSNGKNEYTN